MESISNEFATLSVIGEAPYIEDGDTFIITENLGTGELEHSELTSLVKTKSTAVLHKAQPELSLCLVKAVSLKITK